METKSKINVCVIFGGASSEHEVSKMSVVSVLNNIDRDKYNVHTIMISKSGNWFYYDGAVEDIQSIDDPARRHRRSGGARSRQGDHIPGQRRQMYFKVQSGRRI